MQTTATLEAALRDARALLANQPAKALELANIVLASKPDPGAFRLAAAALRALNRRDEAAQAELRAIAYGVTQPLKEARLAQQAGRSSEAKSIAETYLRKSPDDLLAMTIAAEAAVRLGNLDDAEPALTTIVNRAPAFPPASLLLANVFSAQFRLRDAAEVLENLLRLTPRDANAKRYLADLRAQMNDPFSAASLYEEILASAPDNVDDRLRYAQFLRSAGRRSESVNALRAVIALSPFSGNAWWTLAHYFPDELMEGDEAQIRAAIHTAGVQKADLGFLQLALSILAHRRSDYATAFEAITAAKSLLSSGMDYSPVALSRHVDEMIAAYTPEAFDKMQVSRSDAPIFIVGMPRSGSTLVERILGQHSKIEALGEIPIMPRLVAAEQPDDTAGYRSLLPDSLAMDKLQEMAAWYLERSREYRHTEKIHFTDKYNGNWIRSGLIRSLFPNAKIVDVRRNALDCCWSVFRSVLVGDYADNQLHLASYYADYARFMDAMVAASPAHILTVRYEDIVRDIEGKTRQILDFIGLEFEPACVDFHLSRAAVTTASSEQVRRPINSDSIGSAEPYRRWLRPLIDELEARLGKSL